MNTEMPPLPPAVEKHNGAEQSNREPQKPHNVVKTSGPFSGIEVVALRPGFYAQERKVEGDKFFIKKFEELGSWMRCVDTVMEQKHKAAMAKKKHKNRREELEAELADLKDEAGE